MPDSVPASHPLVLPERDVAAVRRAHHEAGVALRLEELRPRVAEALTTLAGLRPRVLEMGCGHGHFLSAFAQAEPHAGFLGVDYANARIVRARRKQSRLGLCNIAFLRAEALEFLAALPPGAGFDRVFVLFPDPWPKKRHRKNRLMCGPFLERLAGVMPPGADLFFRTDSAAYFEEVVAMVGTGHPSWALAPDAPWPFEHATVFQQKAGGFHSARLLRNAST